MLNRDVLNCLISVIRQKQDILKWIMGIVIETGMMLIKLSAV